MKTVRQTFFALVILTGSVYFGAWFLPAEMQVARTRIINAPVEAVFSEVNDLKKWVQWAPWHKNDSTLQYTLADVTSGLGSAYSWSGIQIGNGRMEAVEWEENRRIQYKMFFGNNNKGISSWTFQPMESATKVTWKFTMRADFPDLHMRYMSLMIDSLLGEWFENGLNELAKRAEFNK